MPIVDKIKINGTSYNVVDNNSGYTSFEYSPSVTNGITVGLMTFNGVTYTIYAPETQQTGTLDISVEDTSLIFYHDETVVPTTVFEGSITLTKMGPTYDDDGIGTATLIAGKTYELFVDGVSLGTAIAYDYEGAEIDLEYNGFDGEAAYLYIITPTPNPDLSYWFQGNRWKDETKLIKIVQLD